MVGADTGRTVPAPFATMSLVPLSARLRVRRRKTPPQLRCTRSLETS